MKKITKVFHKIMSNKYMFILLGAAAGATSVYAYKEHRHNEEIAKINDYYMNEIDNLNCKHEEECLQCFKDGENSMRKNILTLAGKDLKDYHSGHSGKVLKEHQEWLKNQEHIDDAV